MDGCATSYILRPDPTAGDGIVVIIIEIITVKSRICIFLLNQLENTISDFFFYENAVVCNSNTISGFNRLSDFALIQNYKKICYEVSEKEMKINRILNPQFLLVFTVTILHRISRDSVLAQCELSVRDDNKLYNYSLTSPLPKFPHGILSEDGFYKVAANGTVLLFQLCSTMIFNHDPPMCVGCKDCGGPSRCGMGCSALVSNKINGYPVCTTLGRPSTMLIDVLDKKSPHTGIIVKMSNNGPQHNCSLSVTIMCSSNGVQGPQTFDTVGLCDYTTQLKHPSGCAKIISSHGKGLGWFGTLMVIILCLFGVYLLAGTVYRYFVLHIHGIDAIPNLDFWASLPHRVQSLFMSLVRRFRGPSHGYRSSYSPVNF